MARTYVGKMLTHYCQVLRGWALFTPVSGVWHMSPLLPSKLCGRPRAGVPGMRERRSGRAAARWSVLLIAASLAGCGGNGAPAAGEGGSAADTAKSGRTCKIPWHRDDENLEQYEARVRAACPAGYTVLASETETSGSIRTHHPPAPVSQAPRATALDAEAAEFGKSFFKDRMITCGTRTFAHIYRYGDPKLTEIAAPRFVARPALQLTKIDVMNGVDYDGDVQLELDASRTWEGGRWSPWESDSLQVGLENSVFHLKVQHKDGEWSGEAPLAGLIGTKRLDCASLPRHER
jgi:hypothetical protein